MSTSITFNTVFFCDNWQNHDWKTVFPTLHELICASSTTLFSVILQQFSLIYYWTDESSELFYRNIAKPKSSQRSLFIEWFFYFWFQWTLTLFISKPKNLLRFWLTTNCLCNFLTEDSTSVWRCYSQMKPWH